MINSYGIIKFKLKTALDDDFKILMNINGGNVTNKAKRVSIFADSLLNILKYLKNVPKKINPKNGKVIESTLYINLIKK